jgi:acetyl esterase
MYTDAYLKPAPKGRLPPKMCWLFDACYNADKEERKNPLLSPVYAPVETLRSFPPTLIITAGFDSLCAEGERFKDSLVQAGVEVSHRRFPAKHGFTHTKDSAAGEAWNMMTAHLKRYLYG